MTMAATAMQHSAIAAFPVRDGCLETGGIPLTRLAQRVGRTPFFAYDRRLLDDRVGHLRRHLPREAALHYAVKANPMPAVVQHLSGLVDGFDVASANEMKAALDTRMQAQRISFAGPGKTAAELDQAIAADITIEIESAREMQTIADLARRSGLTPRIAVRVNPNFDVKGSGMRMGGGPQQFGIDAEIVPALLRDLRTLGLDFVGFHIFSGSQNLHAELLQAIQEKTIDLALALADHAPAPIRHLNIGGGFGIPYFSRDNPLDIRPIGEALASLIERRLRPALPEAQVIIELGRYIVGEAGIYVTRVIDRKISRGQVFLVTDGGLHHQLAASGNFGQVIRRNYPVAIGNRMGSPVTETATVVGCLCTPLDLLAEKVELPAAEVGDLIVVFQSGAYGLSASPVNFLSHPLPIEILV
jgi:diaminopimelate decarboxylase